jgi:hypothetical protein
MTQRIDQRFSAAHQWAEERAKKSQSPSKFLAKYEAAVSAVRQGLTPDDVRVSYADPVQLAAEIEAFAACRRVYA